MDAELDGESACGLDKDEFSEAFSVFSSDGENLSTLQSVFLPFLKSLGVREESVIEHVTREAKTIYGPHISKEYLYALLMKHVSRGVDASCRDVLRAFRVFDSEGLGFIKVTLLKRFLGQAQLEADDAALERLIRDNCHIDGDDLINYTDFVHNIQKRFGGEDIEQA